MSYEKQNLIHVGINVLSSQYALGNVLDETAAYPAETVDPTTLTNLQKLVYVYGKQLQEIEEAAKDVMDLRYIDTIPSQTLPDTNVNLDIIGDLVGQPRRLEDGTVLSDDDYKLYITARATKNIATCTHDELIEQITLILGQVVPIYLDNLGNATGRVSIATVPDADIVELKESDLLPKAKGVRYLFAKVNDEKPFVLFSNDEPTEPAAPGGLSLGDNAFPNSGGFLGGLL